LFKTEENESVRQSLRIPENAIDVYEMESPRFSDDSRLHLLSNSGKDSMTASKTKLNFTQSTVEDRKTTMSDLDKRQSADPESLYVSTNAEVSSEIRGSGLCLNLMALWIKRLLIYKRDFLSLICELIVPLILVCIGLTFVNN